MSTKTELKTMVIANIGGRTDKDTVILNALDLGLKEIGKLYSFHSMRSESTIAIVANDTYVDLPTGTFKIHEVRLINGTQSNVITIKNKTWIVERWPNIAALSSGRPCVGYVEGGKIYLYPISDGAYDVALTITILPVFASVSSEIPITGLEFTLVCWATAYVYTSLQMQDFAALWRNDFAISLRNAISADKSAYPELHVVDTEERGEEYISATPWLDPFIRGST